jgi:hypothetical protein
VLVGVEVVPPLSQTIIDRLDSLLADSIAAATTADGASAVAAGIAAGEAAAAAMLDARANDGRYGSFTFTSGSDAGEWEPTPPAFVNDPFAWVARVDPFLLESTSQFRTKGPHALKTDIYAKEYNEVKNLGGNGTTTPTLRTQAQTDVARFFTVNPIEMYSRMIRAVSEADGLTIKRDSSRC